MRMFYIIENILYSKNSLGPALLAPFFVVVEFVKFAQTYSFIIQNIL